MSNYLGLKDICCNRPKFNILLNNLKVHFSWKLLFYVVIQVGFVFSLKPSLFSNSSAVLDMTKQKVAILNLGKGADLPVKIDLPT